MKFSVSCLAILATAALLWSPANVSAQNKELIALQRDLADVARKLDALQKDQGERIDKIEDLLRQAAAATHAVSSELKAMQQSLQQSMQKSLTEQQSRVADPLAAVKTGVDSVGQDALAIRSDITLLKSQMTRIETALADLQAAVRVLNAPPAAPPPPAADSADLLFSAAERDFLSGRNDLALAEFRQYWEMYPDRPNAPRALLFIGQIYDRVKQYEDARKAFDTILERFPDSTTTAEAAFWKAEMLAKEGNRTAAIVEYENFAKKYPADLNAETARDRAQQLRRAKGKGK
jgi:TolA-binding protein